MGPVEIMGQIRQERLGIGRIVTGKLVAALVLIIFHALPALPLLVTMAYVWGIPGVRLCRAVIFILSASWFFAALVFLGGHLIWLGVQEARLVLGGGWLVLSAIIPFLHPLNPFLFAEKLLLPGPLANILPTPGQPGISLSALLLWRYNKNGSRRSRRGMKTTATKSGGEQPLANPNRRSAVPAGTDLYAIILGTETPEPDYRC